VLCVVCCVLCVVCVFKQNLNASVEEVESLLVSLILDNKIKGKVDQINQILVLKRE
jgi:COP9 signalosome complex subunit 2